MQTFIQVLTSFSESLREKIVNDPRLENYELKVSEKKKMGRNQGWAKIHSREAGVQGAINIEWDAQLKILYCRVITKGTSDPSQIIGKFISYLLSRYKKKVQAINILKRS